MRLDGLYVVACLGDARLCSGTGVEIELVETMRADEKK